MVVMIFKQKSFQRSCSPFIWCFESLFLRFYLKLAGFVERHCSNDPAVRIDAEVVAAFHGCPVNVVVIIGIE